MARLFGRSVCSILPVVICRPRRIRFRSSNPPASAAPSTDIEWIVSHTSRRYLFAGQSLPRRVGFPSVHVVIMGCGRVGLATSVALTQRGHSVAVVDKRKEAFDRLPP